MSYELMVYSALGKCAKCAKNANFGGVGALALFALVEGGKEGEGG